MGIAPLSPRSAGPVASSTKKLLPDIDWSRTLLDPEERWPKSLRAAAGLVLSSLQPMIILWGPELITVYNDACRPLLGPMHPAAFGQRLRDAWPELWKTAESALEGALAGSPAWLRDVELMACAADHPERIYADLFASPIHDEAGNEAGVLLALSETTSRVLAERRYSERMRQLADAALAINSTLSIEEMLQRVTDHARQLIGAHQAVISLTIDQNWSQAVSAVSLSEKYAAWRSYGDPSDGSGIYSLICKHNKPMRMTQAELTAHPAWRGFGKSAAKHPPMRGWLAAPLTGRNDSNLGVLQLSDKYDGEFTESDEAIAVQLAQMTSVALEKAGLLQGTEAARKVAEAERRELHSLLMHVPAAISIMRGPTHVFELVNPCFRELVGEGRELLGKTYRDALPERASRGDVEILDEVFRTGKPFVQRETRSRVDSRGTGKLVELFLNLVLQPIWDARGRIEGVMTFAVDVTDHVRARQRLEALAEERQRSEEERTELLAREQEARRDAERLNRLKDEFLATVSHELRTPLQAILGWSRLLRGGQADPARLAKGLEVIDRNAKAQAQLIEDILDVSRIIAGKVRINDTTVSIASVIRAAIDTTRPAADAKRIDVVAEIDPEIGVIAGDEDRLQQVVWNLIANAVKFTPAGGHVSVRAARVDTHVEIVVADTGAGIPAEFLPCVFERFRQADATTTRAHGGLGLGLAIVRHLVEMHGGTVRAESEGRGCGATFTVTLPIRAVAAAGQAGASSQASVRSVAASKEAQALTGLHVLVVDDEADARELLVTVLEQFGAVPRAAGSVAEAVTVLEEFRADVLVSDIGMPGEDGYVLLRKLRAIEAERGSPGIPAVALTAYARGEDRRRALLAGFRMHVPKPVEPIELAEAIARAVR
jgi:PAS domain S-box-containing protein